jgi:hypothetical protein
MSWGALGAVSPHGPGPCVPVCSRRVRTGSLKWDPGLPSRPSGSRPRAGNVDRWTRAWPNASPRSMCLGDSLNQPNPVSFKVTDLVGEHLLGIGAQKHVEPQRRFLRHRERRESMPEPLQCR